MPNAVKHFCIIALLTLLQACATAPMSPASQPARSQAALEHLQQIATIQQFSLKGRMGVQTEAKGFSGRLDWQHQPSTDNIALYSPLGSQVASIKKTVGNVVLEDSSGNTVSAKDAESLTQKTLGWKLPLTGLADWSLGRPTASPIQASTSDELGRLTTLQQDGWDIEYSDYADFEGKQLPNKIYMRSPKVNIKLIVENRSNQ